MEVLQDPKIVLPLLIAAVLALVGGIVTQLIASFVRESRKESALRAALIAELGMVREDLGSALATYRRELRNNGRPMPVDFAVCTPVFDANAGEIGLLGKIGLISCVVTTYSSVKTLSEKAKLFSSVNTDGAPIFVFNNLHCYATLTHIQVIKLHSALIGLASNGDRFKGEVELESVKIMDRDSVLMDAGQYHVIMERRWNDA